MKSSAFPCRHEAAVLDAARHGKLGDDLATHAHDCVACRQAAAAGAALREAATTFTAEARLPHAHELLRRASIERHRRATERALLPLRLARIAALAAGAGAAVVLLPLLLPHLPWRQLAMARNLLPGGGPAWVAMGAFLVAVVAGACWLRWEEA